MIAPVTSLQPGEVQRLKQLLANHCCARCMQTMKARSALLRHLEAKSSDCVVAADLGGVPVLRSTLVQMMSKRPYDSRLCCQGLAMVSKAVQQHRLLTSTCTSSTFYHNSAVSTARALLKFACQLLEQSRQVCGTEVDPADACGRAVADAYGALGRHALAPADSPAAARVTADQGPECGMAASGVAHSGTHAEDETAVPAVPFIPRYPRPIQTFDEARKWGGGFQLLYQHAEDIVERHREMGCC
jgi:hypothetical protein